MKNSSFLRKKHAYPASIVIEVKNEEREKDKMPDYMEESKSQKKVIRQKRKMKADITLNIGIYNLPEDVVRGGTMSRNDSTVLKISEPFYLTPESNLFKLNSDSNTSLHSPELVRPSVLECSFPNANKDGRLGYRAQGITADATAHTVGPGGPHGYASSSPIMIYLGAFKPPVT
ncbi:hypothetical protein EGR_03734 [Echinococcus granulosus]|uniref:Uncharacterized protein n=1 Tax=Echinococcus granulosus TaxID=6210 RepID=W6V5B9_ECHGR|nr:hypothetical protein EGR_03734 [Echinococcus granulosus]EUB61444.1 hypothetical protein EGR_03734 [Echinococcus granulosus]